MRHRKSGRKLNMPAAHRKAMFKNLVTSLMVHGRIRTTEAKAKELRRFADRIITLGKQSPTSGLEGLEGEALVAARARRLHNMRRALVWVHDRDALARVFGEYADRFAQRPGGYTRIYKLGPRAGDNADMAIIELVADAYGASAAEDDASDASSSQAAPGTEQVSAP